MKKLVVFLAIILTILSCKKGKNYNQIAVLNNGIQYIYDIPILAIDKNGLETGKWTIDFNSKKNSEGLFSKGYKKGIWKYYPSKLDSFEIKWKTYFSDSISLNIPSNAKLYNVDSKYRVVMFDFNKNGTQENNYLEVSRVKKETERLESHSESLLKGLFEDKVYEFYAYKVVNEQQYFNIFTLFQNEEDERVTFLINFFFEEYYYQVMYKSRVGKSNLYHYAMFFEIANSIRINGNRIYDPFSKVLEFKVTTDDFLK